MFKNIYIIQSAPFGRLCWLPFLLLAQPWKSSSFMTRRSGPRFGLSSSDGSGAGSRWQPAPRAGHSLGCCPSVHVWHQSSPSTSISAGIRLQRPWRRGSWRRRRECRQRRRWDRSRWRHFSRLRVLLQRGHSLPDGGRETGRRPSSHPATTAAPGQPPWLCWSFGTVAGSRRFVTRRIIQRPRQQQQRLLNAFLKETTFNLLFFFNLMCLFHICVQCVAWTTGPW